MQGVMSDAATSFKRGEGSTPEVRPLSCIHRTSDAVGSPALVALL